MKSGAEQVRAGLRVALTYDDVLLQPSHSTVLPNEVNLRTKLTNEIELAIPLMSAAMDTVTEVRLAEGMAHHGGIGTIHKNLSIEDQAEQVSIVKRSETGMLSNPVTLSPNHTLAEARAKMAEYSFSGAPVTDNGHRGGKLVGILSHRDYKLERDPTRPVRELMASADLVTAEVGTTFEQARELLHLHKVEKLPIVDKQFRLVAMYTLKDIEKAARYPNATKDSEGRLRVAAAVGIAKDTIERAEALVHAGVDVLVVDTAHGHAEGVLRMVRLLRGRFSHTPLIAGNVATAEATKALIACRVDAVKVGIGAGSICTTRVVAGVGVPMITAISECALAAYGQVPIIADGGIRYSGDIVKALAVGASCIMAGGLFAATEESPGEVVIFDGVQYKEYRGMGSIGAMQKGSRDRYFQEEKDEFDLEGQAAKKLVAEGVEGRVLYKGTLAEELYQLTGGVRAGMGYCGCKDIPTLQACAELIQTTPAGFREGHVHDVIMTKQPKNYRI